MKKAIAAMVAAVLPLVGCDPPARKPRAAYDSGYPQGTWENKTTCSGASWAGYFWSGFGFSLPSELGEAPAECRPPAGDVAVECAYGGPPQNPGLPHLPCSVSVGADGLVTLLPSAVEYNHIVSDGGLVVGFMVGNIWPERNMYVYPAGVP